MRTLILQLPGIHFTCADYDQNDNATFPLSGNCLCHINHYPSSV